MSKQRRWEILYATQSNLASQRKSADHVRAISNGVHRALIDTYKVPADDHFHLVHQHERHEFIYHPEYLDIHRTDDVVFIHIVAGNWRDADTEKALCKAIAERLSQDPGLRPQDVLIVLSSNERDEWSFRNGLASYVQEPDTVRP